ncbi:MAG: bifunctional 4-hydroxy-2-oxoglutarate aldolase/2-dehydro-3-deoxy-phosphogluconate aldolase [Proteobacteria bacterium]|nr:bifunctional 4-hydroxy-2-oxoglutarate aldolase/2-dehydro-3-deoxy-phosphogluconate aldolase [Pseudomonadota bacterium]
MISLVEKLKIVPVVVLDRAEDAAPTARALGDGGLPVAEITLRTPAALEAIERIAKELPDTLVGAGTVLSAEQAERAIDAGARFIVSPGLDEPVVEAARRAEVTAIPGVSTATEIQRAWNLGLRLLKFFPAELSGGPPMLRSLAAVFEDVRFMPTGGVSPANLGDYLSLPNVVACGGSWLTPKRAISAGEFGTIADLAAQARAAAARFGA